MTRIGATGVIPHDDEERLAAVERYDILDTPPDGAFDRITTLASRYFRVPISTITIVDRDRIWFKSCRGLEADEIGRDPGLCASAILQEEPWVVSDATVDPRTLDNPLVVGELGLRFYLGVPLRTKDGYNLGTINVIDREPREVTAEEVETLRDLAAIVMDELELRLAARREEGRLEQQSSDFIARLSHELRTPLAGVYGAALTLENPAADEEARRHLLALIRTESERMTRTVDHILVGTQLEQGRFTIVPGRVDVGRLVEDRIRNVRERLPKTLSLEVSVPEGLPAAAGSPGAVRRIVDNLIDNAIEFSPEAGRIQVDLEAKGGTVVLRVADEGRGIPPQAQARIFERFYRVEPADEGGGLGLGLYICDQLVRRLGGRIAVESAVGKGSTFVVELPAA